MAPKLKVTGDATDLRTTVQIKPKKTQPEKSPSRSAFDDSVSPPVPLAVISVRENGSGESRIKVDRIARWNSDEFPWNGKIIFVV